MKLKALLGSAVLCVAGLTAGTGSASACEWPFCQGKIIEYGAKQYWTPESIQNYVNKKFKDEEFVDIGNCKIRGGFSCTYGFVLTKSPMGTRICRLSHITGGGGGDKPIKIWYRSAIAKKNAFQSGKCRYL